MSEQSDKPIVTIFGAGIAGLTAAHELIERDFEVIVYERDTDWESAGHDFPCAVGGMAKSQWAWEDPDSPRGFTPDGKRLPARAVRAFTGGTVRFDDADKLAVLTRNLQAHSGPLTLSVLGKAEAIQRGAELIRQAKPDAIVNEEVNEEAEPDEVLVRANPDEPILPAEHGFRFFPGFYRHVFDSMQRTPLSRPSRDDEGPYDRPIRTAYDNLIPTSASGMGLEGEARNFAVEFPRTPPKSVREVIDTLQSFMAGAGYKPRDISKFSLKSFQYMTSSNLRRREEYEDISWWDFIEGESYAEPLRHDLDVAPAILGALVARKSDARTQGSVSVQLLLDQIGGGPRTDALLNGPTTDAWFKPWRDYLQYRGVEFRQGELVDFAVAERNGGESIVPVVEYARGESGRLPHESDYFVVATALPDLSGRPPENDPRGQLEAGLAKKFIEACEKLSNVPACIRRPELVYDNTDEPEPTDVRDFARLAALDDTNWNVTEDSLLQHLIGVQYFFDYNDRQFVSGHSVYLDSKWRLSAISQTRFWRRPPGERDGFDGILSVDIGNVWTETEFVGVYLEQDRLVSKRQRKHCLGCTEAEMALGAFDEIRRATPDNDPLPVTTCFHIDQGVQYDDEGRFIGNHTPYLVNRPGEWRLRPGRLDQYLTTELDQPPGLRKPRGYYPQQGNWFLCGTFMKTHTRLTTMEAANESARHAVNGILERQRVQCGHDQLRVDPCQIWDIEELEPADLRWFKELDERLYQQGHPHFVEILSIDKLPDVLMPGLQHVYEPLLRSILRR